MAGRCSATSAPRRAGCVSSTRSGSSCSVLPMPAVTWRPLPWPGICWPSWGWAGWSCSSIPSAAAKTGPATASCWWPGWSSGATSSMPIPRPASTATPCGCSIPRTPIPRPCWRRPPAWRPLSATRAWPALRRCSRPSQPWTFPLCSTPDWCGASITTATPPLRSPAASWGRRPRCVVVAATTAWCSSWAGRPRRRSAGPSGWSG